ncbi:MAG: hypothetical protein WBP59_06800 [Ilumatobacteraceae bacterium]
MTAIPRRRRRYTILAATAAVVMIIAASVMVVVGAITLSNSKEGEAVGVDERPTVTFPATPNALLAVTSDEGELASLVVLTLLPAGQGGSIVTVPVNADSTGWFGSERQPISDSFDPDDVDALVGQVEGLLSISIERAQIVGAEELTAMLEPVESVQLVLPADVVDTVEEEQVTLVSAGPRTLNRSSIVGVLTAVDVEVPSYDQHQTDVAIWEALSNTAPIASPPEAVPVDDLGRPVPPSSVADLFARLWQGDVGVRDLGLSVLVAADNPTNADVVLLDTRDTVLVFAQISPGLVSSPAPGLNMRVVAQFTSEQLAASGGPHETTSDLMRDLIGRMLFLENNVLSVDSTSSGAPDVTLIEVASEHRLDEIAGAADALFGPSEVVVADTVLVGIDMQVTLGVSYLEREAEKAADSSGTIEETPVEPATTDEAGAPGTVVDDG